MMRSLLLSTRGSTSRSLSYKPIFSSLILLRKLSTISLDNKDAISSFFKTLDEVDYSQIHILPKIDNFKKRYNQQPEVDINDGACFGLATLFLTCFRESIKLHSRSPFNLSWFYQQLKTLSTWDGQTCLGENKTAVSLFIEKVQNRQTIMSYQPHLTHGDVEKILLDETQKPLYELDYSITGTFTKPHFHQPIYVPVNHSKEPLSHILFRDSFATFISSSNLSGDLHATGLVHYGHYYYYDANNCKGISVFAPDKTHELVDEIFSRNFGRNMDSGDLSFKRLKPIKSTTCTLPPTKDILSQINMAACSNKTLGFMAYNQCTDSLSYLLQKSPTKVDAMINRESILNFAVRHNRKRIVTLLLSLGANVELGYITGGTPLQYAALEGNVDIILTLLKHGADPDATNSSGETAIFYGLTRNNIPAVRALILYGNANVNAAMKDGSTPLHMAAFNNSKEMVELLVTFGADINAKNDEGITPLHTALKYGYIEIANYLSQKSGLAIKGVDLKGGRLPQLSPRENKSVICDTNKKYTDLFFRPKLATHVDLVKAYKCSII